MDSSHGSGERQREEVTSSSRLLDNVIHEAIVLPSERGKPQAK